MCGCNESGDMLSCHCCVTAGISSSRAPLPRIPEEEGIENVWIDFKKCRNTHKLVKAASDRIGYMHTDLWLFAVSASNLKSRNK